MKQESLTVFQLPQPPPLRSLGQVALFLDLDGTIAPFESNPARVRAEPSRNELLTKLVQFYDGRVAIISGRSIADLDSIISWRVPAVAGVHGLQRRTTNGNMLIIAAHPNLRLARCIFQSYSKKFSGVLFEDKIISVALHYRNAPSNEAEILELAAQLAVDTGLTLQKGEMVAELRTPGPDKGDAIRSFLSERPFIGHRPIFVGDDLTDEQGFEVVEEAGGIGILVGPERPTRASFGLRDVEEVLRWLKGGLIEPTDCNF